MFLIQKSKWLAPSVRRLVVEAPRVAARHEPGHFVIVRVVEDGERIPLTIADSDKGSGTITMVVQVVGATTERLCALEAGQHIKDIVGPLGKPTEIGKSATWCWSEAMARKATRTSKTESGAKRRGVIMSVLASLSKRLEHFTLGNVLSEINRWIETGQSIFREELATLQEATAVLSNAPP